MGQVRLGEYFIHIVVHQCSTICVSAIDHLHIAASKLNMKCIIDIGEPTRVITELKGGTVPVVMVQGNPEDWETKHDKMGLALSI